MFLSEENHCHNSLLKASVGLRSKSVGLLKASEKYPIMSAKSKIDDVSR